MQGQNSESNIQTVSSLSAQIGQYTFKRWIGQGAYSKVYLAENKSGDKCAIKIFKKNKNYRMARMAKHEAKMLQIAGGRLKYIDYCQSDHYYYIVSNYIQGNNLHQLIHSSFKLSQKPLFNKQQLYKIIGDIIGEMQTIRKHNIVHRDIKPANLICDGKKCTLVDYGFAAMYRNTTNGSDSSESKLVNSKILRNSKQKRNESKNHQSSNKFNRSESKEARKDLCELNDNVGTPLYMAPEILSGKLYNSKCDIWSFGITLYELLYGNPPFPGRTEEQILKNIKKSKICLGKDQPQVLQNLVTKCLQVNVAERIDWKELLHIGQMLRLGNIEPEIEECECCFF